MTSSFRQPRDPYALGSTNYLATAPDLTDAMIKEQVLVSKIQGLPTNGRTRKTRFEQR